VSLSSLRPEIWNGERLVEVCAEVVHDADREHDVHAELWRSVGFNESVV